MSLLVRFLLALVFISSVSTSLAATPEEAAEGLDFAPKWGWNLSGSEGTSFDLSGEAGAVGGSAVKLFVPSGGSASISSEHLAVPSIVGVRYKLLAGDSGEFTAGSSYGEFSTIDLAGEETEVGQWREIETAHFSSYWSATVTAQESDLVVFLDSVTVEPGFKVQGIGHGATVQILPEKESYQKGEWVEVIGHPDQGYEFLYWRNWPDGTRGFEAHWEGHLWGSGLTWPGVSDLTLEAVAGRRVEVSGVAVLVPDWQIESQELKEAGETAGLSLRSLGGGAAVFVEVVGPGFLDFAARTAPESEAFVSRINNVDATSEWKVFSRWFPAGIHRYELEIVGEVELAQFGFEGGFPVNMNVSGQGSVSGVESDGRAGYGAELLLEAEAAEGWVFDRWSGAVDSRNANVSVRTYADTKVSAFFAKPIEVGGLEALSFGDQPWTPLGEAGAVSPGSLAKREVSYLEWRLEGPGTLSFDARSKQGYASIYLNDIQVASIYNSGSEAEFAKREIAVGPGLQSVRVELEGNENSDADFEVELANVSWDGGLELELVATPGGTVTGHPLGVTRTGYFAEIALQALPDAGYVFAGWSGSASEAAPVLDFSVERDSFLIAEFAKPVEDDAVVEGISGHGDWTKVDGNWRSPTSLAEGEFGKLIGEVEGPGRLKVAVGAVGEGDWGETAVLVDGEQVLAFGSEGEETVTLSAGRHKLAVVARRSAEGGYRQVELTTLTPSYPVQIEVPHYSFSSVPQLFENNFGSGFWTGYLEHGVEFTFETDGGAGVEFMGWTGDFSGKDASDSLVVQGPVEAKADFAFTTYERDGVAWAVEPASGAYRPRYYPEIGFDGSEDVLTLSGAVVGPGTLYLFPVGLASVGISINGEEFVDHTNSGLEVGEGEHEIVVKATLHPSQTGRPGFQGLRYWSGYFVYAGSSPGGEVTKDVESSYVEPGSVVQFTATPKEGNVFVDWAEPFSGNAATFSAAINGPTQVRAQFAATAEVGGYTWDYAGKPPEFGGAFYHGPNGSFEWTLSEADGKSVAETALSGGGLLVFERLQRSNRGYAVAVLVDDVLVELSETEEASRLLKAEGSVLRIEVERTDVAQGSSEALLRLPVLRETASLTVTGDDVAIPGAGEEMAVAPGQLLSFEAPESNDFGHRFAGWWSGQGLWDQKLVTSARVLEVAPVSDLYLRARYEEDLVGAAEALIFDRNGGGWQWYEGATSPSGNGSFQGSDRSVLEVRALEDATVSWAYRMSTGRLAIRDVNADALVETLSEGIGVWMYSRVFVEAGEFLTIEVYGGLCSISDFKVESGWRPAYVADRVVSFKHDEVEGRVAVDPGLHGDFVGWLNDDREIEAFESVAMESGEKRMVRPLFGRKVDSSLGELTLNHDLAWTSSSADGFPYEIGPEQYAGVFIWESQLNESGPRENRISFPVEGPAVLDFDRGSGALTVSVGGEPVELYKDVPTERWKAQIPAGSHLVSFWHEPSRFGSGSLTVYDARLTTGYALRRRHYKGGAAFPAIEKEIYNADETIEYVAYSSDGYQFSGWLPPYDEEPRRLELKAPFEPLPVPVFESIPQFEMGGRTWTYWGAHLKTVWRERDDVISRENYLSSFESGSGVGTTIEGPAILRFSGNAWQGDCEIDGSPLHDPRFVSEFDGEGAFLVSVGAGEHTLRWYQHFNWAFDPVEPGIAVIPGVQLVLGSTGRDLAQVSPPANAFAEGEAVEITAYDKGPLEYFGLPLDATVVDGTATFSLEESRQLGVAQWRPATYFGQSASFSGSERWKEVNGKYLSPILKNRGWTFLRFVSEESGMLNYSFGGERSNSIPKVRMRIWINGAEVPVSPSFSGVRMDWSGSLYLASAEDEVVWGFSESSLFQVSDARVSLDGWSFQALEVNDYLAWLSNKLQSYGYELSDLDPYGDPDGDGIVNYLEYLLKTDPLVDERFLSIGWRDAGTLALTTRHLTAEQQSLIALRHLSGGEESDASVALSDIVELHGDFESRRVLALPESGASLFFYRYDGEVPTLEAMLGEE